MNFMACRSGSGFSARIRGDLVEKGRKGVSRLGDVIWVCILPHIPHVPRFGKDPGVHTWRVDRHDADLLLELDPHRVEIEFVARFGGALQGVVLPRCHRQCGQADQDLRKAFLQLGYYELGEFDVVHRVEVEVLLYCLQRRVDGLAALPE